MVNLGNVEFSVETHERKDVGIGDFDVHGCTVLGSESRRLRDETNRSTKVVVG